MTDQPTEAEARGFAQSVFGTARKHSEPERDPADEPDIEFVRALFGTPTTDDED